MKDLIEAVRKTPKLILGDKADVYHNIDARKYLAEEGFAVFPDEYFSFVKYINGIRSDDGELYAILPDEDKFGFNDAVFTNVSLNRPDKAKISVLGENSFDYLVYDHEDHEYQFRDRVNDDITYRFETFSQAVSLLFSV